MPDTVVVAMIAAVVGIVTSLGNALLARPRNKAEAEQSEANAAVAVSEDAREWARVFIERADRAEARASEAERKAADCQRVASEQKDRIDELEDHVEDMAAAFDKYVRQTGRQIRNLGGEPPEVPDVLAQGRRKG